MKNVLIACLVFGLGLAGGAAIRFSQHWQHGYRTGYSAAVVAMRCEAVREGHGRWQLKAGQADFEWNETRTYYRPDSESLIPGLE